MARHDPAGEEMPRDPIVAIGVVEQVGSGAMREDMQKEAAVGFQPGPHARHQFAPVHHVLEHLDGDDAVEPGRGREHVHV